ncbi:hypothetical protein Hanom_Chr10g00948621 [Helianthus anomalus]
MTTCSTIGAIIMTPLLTKLLAGILVLLRGFFLWHLLLFLVLFAVSN